MQTHFSIEFLILLMTTSLCVGRNFKGYESDVESEDGEAASAKRILSLLRELANDEQEEGLLEKREPHQRFSSSQKQKIVDMHNNYRKTVQPPAATGAMQTISWSSDMENEAVNWAQCGTLWYTHNDHRSKNYGQNIAETQQSGGQQDLDTQIGSSIDMWWNEKKDFDMNSGKCAPSKICTHYTQMAWSTSNQIGCGYALNCPVSTPGPMYSFNFYIVCNYKLMGNTAVDMSGKLHPYPLVGEKIESDDTNAPTTQSPTVKMDWTFGGTAGGAVCSGSCKTDNDIAPWCTTSDGTWGYCKTGALVGTARCADSDVWKCQDALENFHNNECPSDKTIVKQQLASCDATCKICECKTPACARGQRDGSCGCTCPKNTGYAGPDCSHCSMTSGQCQNKATFDSGNCKCNCPSSTYSGADCSCKDSTASFTIDGKEFKCNNGWVEKFCTDAQYGQEIQRHCPTTCDSCPSPVDMQRDSNVKQNALQNRRSIVARLNKILTEVEDLYNE